MRPSTVVFLLLAAAAYFRPWNGLFRSGEAPAVVYKDTRGHAHALNAPERPTVVMLWVSPCAYCDRAFKVLQDLRRLYPEDKLSIVALYLNPATDQQIEQMGAAEGGGIDLAQGQPDGPTLEKLLDGLSFRGTGRDIYVIGVDGRYTKVDSSDLRAPRSETLDAVRRVLRDAHRLAEAS